MDKAEYKKRYEGQGDPTPGWDALDARLREVYGTREPLHHYAPAISSMLGGPDPLDGISIYESRAGGTEHLHFCTYGFSSLYYDEESVGGDFSKFGFEMTFRLASPLPPADGQIWACNLMQNIARYVFKSGRRFKDGHWIPANGPIRADYATEITGLVFQTDPELGAIDTPHGRVEFLQAFGITDRELAQLKNKEKKGAEIVEAHRGRNPLLVTDLSRRDGCAQP